jgi:hypothetical protein
MQKHDTLKVPTQRIPLTHFLVGWNCKFVLGSFIFGMFVLSTPYPRRQHEITKFLIGLTA